MTTILPDFPLDRLALRNSGTDDAPALVVHDTVYSYKELNKRVGRLAFLLRASGMKEGDRVATWTAKGLIACLMPLAAVRAGCVHVPINPLLKAAQAAHIIADSSAALLIANAARLATLADMDQNGVHLVDEAAAALVTGDDDAGALPPLPPGTDPGTLAAILYTSGSTGRPKGVMLSHRNLAIGAVSVAQYLRLAADDVTLAVLPLSFDYGQNQLLSTWQAGGCAVPLDYLTPRDVVKACARHSVTTLAAVPPLWLQLAEIDWPEEARAPLRRITNSGGAMTPSLLGMLRNMVGPKTDIHAMYGLTEAFRSASLDPALIDANPSSFGKAIPYAEIMVMRPDGTLAADDEPGELVHAGPLVAQGYWRDTQRTAERFKPAPAWSQYGGMAVYSGDTVRRDADGLHYFVGRDDAMIKTSGNRVSPSEIEEAAVASGIVAEACAMGRDDERLGQAVVLFVRGEDDDAGEKAKKLRRFLKQALPNFMQPADIIWLKTLPKNANGKLDRNALESRLVS